LPSFFSLCIYHTNFLHLLVILFFRNNFLCLLLLVWSLHFFLAIVDVGFLLHCFSFCFFVHTSSTKCFRLFICSYVTLLLFQHFILFIVHLLQQLPPSTCCIVLSTCLICSLHCFFKELPLSTTSFSSYCIVFSY